MEYVILLLLVIGTLAIIYGLALTPNAKAKTALQRRARHDHEHARGSAHLRMLREARAGLDKRLAGLESSLATAQEQLATQRADQERALTRALSRHLIQSRLHEVRGIGPALRDRIERSVFKDHLTDLRLASKVPGVGAAKQDAINQWVSRYVAQLPDLLAGEFPGKKGVLAQYKGIAALEARIPRLEQQRAHIQQHLDPVRKAIARLESVTVVDFYALLRPESERETTAPDRVDTYQNGVFAEWQPMPDWFREAIAASREQERAA